MAGDDHRGGSYGITDGYRTAAKFRYPRGIAVDAEHNLVVADTSAHTVRWIRPNGLVSTLIGKAGTLGKVYGLGSVARLYSPVGLAVRGTTVYLAISSGHAIGRFELGQCGDGDPCTTDSCNATTGTCSHTTLSSTASKFD